jgi:hypothetical protein
MKGSVRQIDYQTAIGFLLPRHYSGRKPNVAIAFGWFDDENVLKAVCTFGKPASPPLCSGICGVENKDSVYELNRLCRTDDWAEPLSQFVSYCLREISKKDWIVVSFADTDMNHNGYIYQACNFLYTGKTKERTDKYTENNKHPRHYDNSKQGEFRKIRSAKHRYVYFCTKNKRLKAKWQNDLNYEVMQYPKGDNQNYVLGDYQKCKLVKIGE